MKKGCGETKDNTLSSRRGTRITNEVCVNVASKCTLYQKKMLTSRTPVLQNWFIARAECIGTYLF